MLFSSLLLVPTIAHAATGQVNINGGAQVLGSPFPSTVSVPINIAGSDALNGFDVQVFADPTILSATSVSVTGSVIASPTIVIECINGILVAGSTCAPQDGNGVVHLGAAHIGSLTVAPTSGLLFTINYNVVGNTAGTPISFNTGCAGTSVSGDCVTVSNGSPTAVPETDLGTTFANLNDFTITPAFASISTPAGVAITDTINYAAKGAFSDSLTETVTGPCTLGTGSVDLSFPTGSDTLTCSSATNGDFTVTVTATGFSTNISHSATIMFHVGAAGFSSTLNHSSITVPRGTSDSTTIVTLTGVSGFSGSVSIVATGPAGITGSASPAMVTLTPDGSGYSTGTSTLTITVAGTVATGIYTVTVTGGSTLSVTVPGLDFSIAALPSAESVPRGGSAVATISLTSLGSFAGTVTLSATIVATGLDVPATGVNNIAATFLPATVTLTAGGSGSTAFSGGTVKIGTSPNPANTATGNYTATITATSGSLSHSVAITFNVFDFSLGPNYCAGSSQTIYTSPDTFFNPVSVGETCNTFTLTTQTTAQGGGQSTLWMQVNSLGGFATHGAAGTGVVAAVNPTGPGTGSRVPELHRNVCFFQTYFANGTQLSRAYIQANGPVVRAGPVGGCRFSFAYAVPNDIDAVACVPPDNVALLDCANANNPDFFAIYADSLSHTLPGTYLVNVCGLVGTLLNCQMITLIVVSAPIVHQFVYTHSVSIGSGGVQSFKLGVTNPDTHVVYAQVTVTGTGSFGDTFTVTTGVFKINPNANANNLALSVRLTRAEIGETFTFSSSILVSAVDAGAVAVDPINGTTSAGTSTLSSVTATFSVTA